MSHFSAFFRPFVGFFKAPENCRIPCGLGDSGKKGQIITKSLAQPRSKNKLGTQKKCLYHDHVFARVSNGLDSA